MSKQQAVSISASDAKSLCGAVAVPEDLEQLRCRLSELQAEVEFYRSRHDWLSKALETQRHARQMLEASVTSRYSGAIDHIRKVVQDVVPAGSTILVVSKGDPELLKLRGRRALHFPQNEDGLYAGHYPADSATAVAGLAALIAKGAEYLLLPNTAFWWLEHYRELDDWLNERQSKAWQDDRCVVFRFSRNSRRAKPLRPADDKRPMEPGRLRGAAKSEYPTIVCFPLIDWGFRYQRPQQLLSRCAAAGHKVFYLSHHLRTSGDPCQLRSLASNLWEVSLRGPRFPARDGVLGEGHRQELGGSLAALKKDYVTEAQPAIALVHSPFWWPVVNDVAEAFSWPVVYDCMDLHAGFSTANPILLEYERELLTRAQLVVASSAVLEAQARRFNQNVLLLRNGCDYEHFSRVRPKPRKGRPIIGYYGAIAEWFDTDLVTDLARRRPDWDFILVGSTHGADIRRLQQLPNVSLPGEKPYSELLMWLARFDVAILPFKRNPLTEAANPVKAYEILAAGKPLVSVPLPEIRTFGHLVRVATAVGDFERQIELELCHPEGDLKSRRQVFAKENSWDRRFDLLRRGIRPTGSNNFRNSRPKVGIPIQFGCETNMQ